MTSQKEVPTKRTRKNRKRRTWQAELKRIETKFHPSPRIEEVEICHEHRGRRVVFTGWIGDRRLGGELCVSRATVLCSADLYAEYGEKLRLVRKEAAP